MVRILARRKKAKEGSKGAPEWMTTFSDLMNLLLCFFVLLFSMSAIDAKKFEDVVTSFSSSFSIFENGSTGVLSGNVIENGINQLENIGEYFDEVDNEQNNDGDSSDDPLEEYKEQLKEEQQQVTEEMYENISGLIDKNKIDQYVSVGIDENFQYIKLSMYGEIMFDSGKAEIKSDAVPILNRIGDILKLYDDCLIKIEGHTDNVPVKKGSVYKDNLWLSTARASTVWEYLTEVKKLDPKTLESSGRSEYDPVADNSTSEGRKKNRRVEFKIYANFDN